MTDHVTSEDSEQVPLTADVVERLVASHARFLAFLERRVASREVAEELLQEAFVRAITRGDGLRDAESATAWFYRLLRNALTDHYRGHAAQQRALDRAGAEPQAVSTPQDELMATVCACVHELAAALKPEYAQAIRMVDLEEGSLADYAAAAGITANNASVRLHRARAALHRSLVRSCGTCATHGCLDCHCKPDGSGC